MAHLTDQPRRPARGGSGRTLPASEATTWWQWQDPAGLGGSTRWQWQDPAGVLLFQAFPSRGEAEAGTPWSWPADRQRSRVCSYGPRGTHSALLSPHRVPIWTQPHSHHFS